MVAPDSQHESQNNQSQISEVVGKSNGIGDVTIDQISNFVEEIQMASTSSKGEELKEWHLSEQLLLNVEHFKVTVEKPTGTTNEVHEFIKTLVDSQDDEFFHLTCHVNVALRQKIVV